MHDGSDTRTLASMVGLISKARRLWKCVCLLSNDLIAHIRLPSRGSTEGMSSTTESHNKVMHVVMADANILVTAPL